MKKDAVISTCGKYRYALRRIWDEKKSLVMFIGLNPSTADDKIDDNTIRRCMTFAGDWNFGGLIMGNLFALRSTDPRELKRVSDPIGPENNEWLKRLSEKSDKVIAVWGNHGAYLKRDSEVLQMFKNLYCLKISLKGIPCHPLYLPKDLKPILLVPNVLNK